MKLQNGDLVHATVGILGMFGVIYLVQVLPEILGHTAGSILGTLVIIWGGLTSSMMTYSALKGGYGKLGNHHSPED
jgi:hypothetical protein